MEEVRDVIFELGRHLGCMKIVGLGLLLKSDQGNGQVCIMAEK